MRARGDTLHRYIQIAVIALSPRRVCIVLASMQAHLDDVCGGIMRSLSSVNALLGAIAHTAHYGVLLCADIDKARARLRRYCRRKKTNTQCIYLDDRAALG